MKIKSLLLINKEDFFITSQQVPVFENKVFINFFTALLLVIHSLRQTWKLDYFPQTGSFRELVSGSNNQLTSLFM